jgi:hypothetical protein
MDRKILFATYQIRIKNNKRDYQFLDRFNGEDDFFNTFKTYTEHIFENTKTLVSKNIKKKFTLREPCTINETDRTLFGYFNAGLTGEKKTIKNDEIPEEGEFKQEKYHSSYQPVFFYIYIPKGKKEAHLILQKEVNFGIKTNLKNTLIEYVLSLGYLDNRIEFSATLHHSVYKKMMEYGKLKRIELITKRIPSTPEDLNSPTKYSKSGRFVTSLSSNTDLGDVYKTWITGLNVSGDKHKQVEIREMNDTVDEVEFELELDGSTKKFYVADTRKPMPYIDVTDNLEFDDTEEPTKDSLIKKAEELIKEMINPKI